MLRSLRYSSRVCCYYWTYKLNVPCIVGNLARLKPRQLYKVIAAQSSWSSKFNIGLYNEALAELFYWKDHIKLLNVQHIFAYKTPGVLVSSDASDVACGDVIAGTSLVCHCMHVE